MDDVEGGFGDFDQVDELRGDSASACACYRNARGQRGESDYGVEDVVGREQEERVFLSKVRAALESRQVTQNISKFECFLLDFASGQLFVCARVNKG